MPSQVTGLVDAAMVTAGGIPAETTVVPDRTRGTGSEHASVAVAVTGCAPGVNVHDAVDPVASGIPSPSKSQLTVTGATAPDSVAERVTLAPSQPGLGLDRKSTR